MTTKPQDQTGAEELEKLVATSSDIAKLTKFVRERKNQGTFSQVPVLTPDEKLEDSLLSIQLDGLGVTWETATYYQRTVISSVTNELLQLITADRKRVALEARLDELERLQAADMNLYKNVVIAHRIAELEAQQEEVR